MNKNIALFFDGTWQAPKEDRKPVENSNVRKLFLRVMEADPAKQVREYFKGIGTQRGFVRK